MSEDPADFLRRSDIPWTATFLQIRLAPKSCLFPFERDTFASGRRFHAHESSEPSPYDCLIWSLQKRVQANELKALAQKSVGTNDSALSIQITQTIAQIELLDSQFKKVETKMTEIMKFLNSVIMTIPGIRYINGGIILGEIKSVIFTVFQPQ